MHNPYRPHSCSAPYVPNTTCSYYTIKHNHTANKYLRLDTVGRRKRSNPFQALFPKKTISPRAPRAPRSPRSSSSSAILFQGWIYCSTIMAGWLSPLKWETLCAVKIRSVPAVLKALQASLPLPGRLSDERWDDLLTHREAESPDHQVGRTGWLTVWTIHSLRFWASGRLIAQLTAARLVCDVFRTWELLCW